MATHSQRTDLILEALRNAYAAGRITLERFEQQTAQTLRQEDEDGYFPLPDWLADEYRRVQFTRPIREMANTKTFSDALKAQFLGPIT